MPVLSSTWVIVWEMMDSSTPPTSLLPAPVAGTAGPCAAPLRLDYATPSPCVDLRAIAIRQKAMLYCLLGEGLTLVLMAVMPREVYGLAYLAFWAFQIAAVTFFVMLAVALDRIVAGIILGLVGLVPFVGVLVTLSINGQATALLRWHGIKVGLMGARSSQIPS